MAPAWPPRPVFPRACLLSNTHRLTPGKYALYQGVAAGGTHGFLKGVDEVLQVNVVPVGSDVALKELPEPIPHPILE